MSDYYDFRAVHKDKLPTGRKAVTQLVDYHGVEAEYGIESCWSVHRPYQLMMAITEVFNRKYLPKEASPVDWSDLFDYDAMFEKDFITDLLKYCEEEWVIPQKVLSQGNDERYIKENSIEALKGMLENCNFDTHIIIAFSC